MPTKAQYGVPAPYLTNYSLAMVPNEMFVAPSVLPWAPVPDESFRYTDFDDGAFVPSGAAAGEQSGLRNLGSTYQQVTFGFGNGSGLCKEYGFEATMDKREPRMGRAAGVDVQQANSILVRQQFMTAWEIRAATLLFNTTTFASQYEALGTTGARWDNALSDPADQAIKAKRLTRRAASANQGGAKWCCLVGEEVHDALKTNPAIISRIVNTSKVVAGNVTDAEIQAYLDVDEYYHAGAIYNSVGDTGAGSLTGADVWGKYALFFWKSPTPGRMLPSLGYTFGTEQYMVEQYTDDTRRSDVIRGRGVQLEKVVNVGAAYLYSTVIS